MMYIVLYLLTINVISYIMMYQDKQKAIKKEWRTPESTIWITAVVGGSIGVWLGMVRFRHKTKHLSFKLGLPVLIILQIAVSMYLFQSFFS